MKRVILCILGCILLMVWTGAAAEDCAHEHQVVRSVLSGWKDMEAGHQWEETRLSVCDNCGKKFARQTISDFEGHEIHLSESIHFEAESRHLCVFICPICWHVMLEEYPCSGGDVCEIFRPQAGEMPQVQQGESLEAQRLLTVQDYIRRWLAQDRKE